MWKRFALSIALAALATTSFQSQGTGTLQLTVMLVDSELAVKPVPRHAMTIASTNGEPRRVVTGLDGKAAIQLPEGQYAIESDRAVEFQNRTYKWLQRISIKSNQALVLELSSDNATVGTLSPAREARPDLPSLFKRWQGSVVTVWSDTGHGSGFVIDKRGLIATNQHVLGVSEYAAVQFSDNLKVRARIVTKSPEKDVAILQVNPKFVADIEPVTLGFAIDGKSPVIEGEQVFTIGSPLNQRKIMTTGIVSKVEARAIISDVNINHGNSGGPLFTTGSVVVGITTFGDFTNQGGPGISGIVRIDEAREQIEQASRSLVEVSASTLPVEPSAPYPVSDLKALLDARPVKAADYVFATSDFEVTVLTPVLSYGAKYAEEQAALRERAKRNRKPQSVQGSTENPFAQYKNWAEYVGEYRPVVIVDARPKLVEGFWSSVSRGLASQQGVLAQAQLHFKSDFYRMRLMCGEKEVIPIHPFKIEHRLAVRNAAVNVNDSSYEGFYTFGPDDIGPHCGTVGLVLFTEKEPEKGDARTLSPKLVQRVWDDFAPYRAATGSKGTSTPTAASPSSATDSASVPLPPLPPQFVDGSKAPPVDAQKATPPAPTGPAARTALDAGARAETDPPAAPSASTPPPAAPSGAAAKAPPARTADPAASRTALDAGARAETARDWPTALQQYERARALDPTMATFIDVAIARVRERMNGPADADALRRAKQYDALGRRSEAITWYQKALEAMPQSDPNRELVRKRLSELTGKQ